MRETVDVESVVVIPRSEIEGFLRRFDFVANFQSPFLSTYAVCEILSQDRNSVQVVMRELTRYQLHQHGSGEYQLTAVSVIQGIREAQSMGICVSSKFVVKFSSSGRANLIHWAHDWLCGRPGIEDRDLRDLISKRFKVELSGNTVQDWIGFLTLNHNFPSQESIDDVGTRPTLLRKQLMALIPQLTKTKLDPKVRLEIYRFVLESDDVHAHVSLSPCFLRRFASLVSGQCAMSQEMLALQFHRRVVLEAPSAALVDFLRLIDLPLCECVASFQDATDQLFASILANTLSDSDLVAVWDALLVSPPELLVRLVAFALVEIRDLVLSDSAADAILTIGELVPDFKPVLLLALANNEL